MSEEERKLRIMITKFQMNGLAYEADGAKGCPIYVNPAQ